MGEKIVICLDAIAFQCFVVDLFTFLMTFGKTVVFYMSLFFLKEIEILFQERREQMKTIMMENYKGILFNKSGPTNKQRIYQPIIVDQW